MKRVARGFTLIELMAVIAIIGILATIVTISLISSRVRGRDAQRVATLQILRAAIDQYAVDHGHYPTTGAGICGSGNCWTGFDPTNIYFGDPIINPDATNIVTALSPYLNQPSYIDPSGPAGVGSDKGYLYRSDGTDYVVWSYGPPENIDNFEVSLKYMNRCVSITSGICSGVNTVGYWTKNAVSW